MAPMLRVPSALDNDAERALVMGEPEYPKVTAPPTLTSRMTKASAENSSAASAELIVTLALSTEMGPEYEPPLRNPVPRTRSPSGKPRRAASESKRGIESEPSRDSSEALKSMPGV